MSTIVNIWLPGSPYDKLWEIMHMRVGHASMKIEDKYYSFWSKKGKLGKEDKSQAGVFESFPADFYTENEDKVAKGFIHEWEITIEGMNESSMVTFWEDAISSQEYYELFSQNCCIMVVKALRVGFLGTEQGRKIMDNHKKRKQEKYEQYVHTKSLWKAFSTTKIYWEALGEFTGTSKLETLLNVSIKEFPSVTSLTPRCIVLYAILIVCALKGYELDRKQVKQLEQYIRIALHQKWFDLTKLPIRYSENILEEGLLYQFERLGEAFDL